MLTCPQLALRPHTPAPVRTPTPTPTFSFHIYYIHIYLLGIGHPSPSYRRAPPAPTRIPTPKSCSDSSLAFIVMIYLFLLLCTRDLSRLISAPTPIRLCPRPRPRLRPLLTPSPFYHNYDIYILLLCTGHLFTVISTSWHTPTSILTPLHTSPTPPTPTPTTPPPTKTYTTLVPKLEKHPPFRGFWTKKHPLFNQNCWFWGPMIHPFLKQNAILFPLYKIKYFFVKVKLIVSNISLCTPYFSLHLERVFKYSFQV